MKQVLSLIVCVILLSGCTTIEKEVLDEIYLVTLAGYDLEDDKIQATLVVPIYQTEGTVRNEFYTAEGYLNQELDKEISLQTPNPVFPGKLEIAMFSEEFASKGFIELTDVYRRDPSISANVRLAVYDGNIKEFIYNQQVQNMDLGMHVAKIIEQAIEAEVLPKTNLHLFFQSYYGEGEDPFLPLLTRKNGKLKIKGIALFKGEKMVDQVLDDRLYIFGVLHNELTKGRLSIELPKQNARVSIGHVKTNKKVHITGTSSSPNIKLSIDLTGTIDEYSGGRKRVDKNIKKIENRVNQYLEKETQKMINSYQEQGVDPFGIGKEAKAHFRDWDSKTWQEIYPQVNIQTEINMDIVQSGVIR
ncbi:Ger(x)C family spore germination protein [Pseudalkalibacillus decolorationis]|uniref:Ger(x)C family spore germination protein n=1 Tax=Pseudalkalibacillus decolorationis TaxID=163879 RepID=UPI002149129F|nr:Ger(x)C family spore germination protein [Pseudalkalibacillus decolorationis]